MEPVEQTLAGLMVEYQRGDVSAFERLYALLRGPLSRHFDAASREAAADLVQETFLEMHRSRHTYRPPLPVLPWALGIARNVLRRHRRTSWRRRLEVGAGEDVREPAAPATATAGEVEDALGQLPQGRRQAWELHHVQGFSFHEIGRRLRIPAGAAKLRSSRAMGTLRALLGVGARRRRD